VVVLVAVALILWPGDDSANNVQTTPTSAAPVTPAPDPEAATRAAVLDGYQKAFDAFIAVASDPNARFDDLRLAETSMGDALLAKQAGIVRLRTDGLVFTGAVEMHPTVLEVGGGVATVEDCSIDRTATVELATGRVLSPPGTEGGLATAELRVDALGVWKVNEFNDEGRSCVPPES